MLIAVDGLVIRSSPSGDSDHVLQILTDSMGKLSVLIKGGKKSKKDGALACTQLFTYANFEIYQGKDDELYWFRSASIISTYFCLTKELPAMGLAQYFCEVASECSRDHFAEEDSKVLLRLLLNTLHSLAAGKKSPRLLKGAFEWRVAILCGFEPDLRRCAVCGAPHPQEAYLDVMNGSFICADCQTKRNRMPTARDAAAVEEALRERRVVCPVSSSVMAAIRYTMTAPDKKLFSFVLKDPEEEYAFERASEAFLLHHLERDFTTLHFYRSVELDWPRP